MTHSFSLPTPEGAVVATAPTPPYYFKYIYFVSKIIINKEKKNNYYDKNKLFQSL